MYIHIYIYIFILFLFSVPGLNFAGLGLNLQSGNLIISARCQGLRSRRWLLRLHSRISRSGIVCHRLFWECCLLQALLAFCRCSPLSIRWHAEGGQARSRKVVAQLKDAMNCSKDGQLLHALNELSGTRLTFATLSETRFVKLIKADCLRNHRCQEVRERAR